MTPQWMLDGACRSKPAKWFFPPDSGGKYSAQVMAVGARYCNACPVKEQCLDYALRLGIEHGVWGGLGPAERDAMTRARR